MKQQAPFLRRIRIRDFKSHKDTIINFGKRTEIYGENKQGKTSVHDAIKFALWPKKEDKDKIRLGQKKSIVELEANYNKEGEEKPSVLTIKSTVDETGNCSRIAKIDGKSIQRQADFLRTLISCGSFDPKQILEKKDRQQRLLSLLPLKVTPEDFSEIDCFDPKEINFKDHAFIVLTAVDTAMRITKRALFQKMDLLKKHWKKYEQDFINRNNAYKENYPAGNINYEEVQQQFGRLDADFKTASERVKEIKNNINDSEGKIGLYEGSVKTLKERIKENRENMEEEKRIFENLKEAHQKKMSDMVTDIKILEERVLQGKSKIDNEKAKKDTFLPKLEQAKEDVFLHDKKKEELKSGIVQAKEQMSIDNMGNEVIRYKTDADNAFNEHERVHDQIKKDFPAVRKKLLTPLKDMIPGFDMDSFGNILIDSKSVDELSESETVELAVKFMSIENKSKFICIDGAELFDKKTLKEVDFPESMDVLLIRVSEEELGDDWKSIKIEKGSSDQSLV